MTESVESPKKKLIRNPSVSLSIELRTDIESREIGVSERINEMYARYKALTAVQSLSLPPEQLNLFRKLVAEKPRNQRTSTFFEFFYKEIELHRGYHDSQYPNHETYLALHRSTSVATFSEILSLAERLGL